MTIIQYFHRRTSRKLEYSKLKLLYPYEYFNSMDDYQQPVDNLKKEDLFSKLKKSPDDDGIERTKQFIETFVLKVGEEIIRLYMKTDKSLLADVFEKLIKVTTKKYKINPLYCVSICSYNFKCCLKFTDIKLQTNQGKDVILLGENSILGGKSSVMCNRYGKSNEKKIIIIDATKLFGHSRSHPLTFDEIKFEKKFV